ncbi:MAG: hypothetical protein FJY75_03905 [Candidatus Eisenbacteria bacterium]|uniref:T9SS type A sorting domain-containing protein n=1 Tax=Eiseniibacteriota bacterium TaxID=2212470 RepID=A0A937XBP7_UNCEI|nr:hypothetical protein [Candidatus Eisenbacteria bacterium]
MTGAPGEGTCHACHGSFPLNSGDGLFTIAGPELFAPGHTYTITVTISDPGQSRWGFEITPLDQGACAVTDPAHTQLSSSGGRSYVKQTSAGTFPGSPGPVSWSFDWTAPVPSPPEVMFYAAGNAANGNGLTSGDYIYTAAFAAALDAADVHGATSPGAPLALLGAPNPAPGSVRIRFELPDAGHARLDVLDASGRIVARLVDAFAAAGRHELLWSGAGEGQRPLPGGIYFCRLSAGSRTFTRPVVLLRAGGGL